MTTLTWIAQKLALAEAAKTFDPRARGTVDAHIEYLKDAGVNYPAALAALKEAIHALENVRILYSDDEIGNTSGKIARNSLALIERMLNGEV